MAFRFLSQANIHYVSEWFTLNWSVKFLIIRMHYQQKKNSRQNKRQISVDKTRDKFLSTKREENSVDENRKKICVDETGRKFSRRNESTTCRLNGRTPVKIC